MEGYRYIFKIILVGTSAVGKTSLIEQYTQGYFRHDPIATIGVDFRIKSMNMDGDEVKMQIWDPSGQERFRSVVQSYYRNAHAVVLVYDLTSHHTYENLPDWIDEIERHCDGGVLKILVGNKVDSAKYREVPTYVGREFALSNGFTFFVETSAWDASNVDVLFRNIALCLRNEVKTKNSRSAGTESAMNEARTADLRLRSRSVLHTKCCRL